MLLANYMVLLQYRIIESAAPTVLALWLEDNSPIAIANIFMQSRKMDAVGIWVQLLVKINDKIYNYTLSHSFTEQSALLVCSGKKTIVLQYVNVSWSDVSMMFKGKVFDSVIVLEKKLYIGMILLMKMV